MKDEKYPSRIYEVVFDFRGEFKLTLCADDMFIAVIAAKTLVKGILGFVPKILSIREIKEEEK